VRVGDGPRKRSTARLKDLKAAVDWVCKWLIATDGTAIRALSDIEAVGHRVVHGGERFRRSVLIDESVLAEIEDMIELAPLHNPANIKGIEAVTEILGKVPQTVVFDTAFHHTLPDRAYLYALPYWVYRRYKIRRYGFHGTSHRYVAHRYRQLTGHDKPGTSVITLHLGNGASACAIKGGRSIDTSMGFTPLEGLVMGTRAGDMDPAILDFLAAKEGLSDSAMQNILNKQSGLQGISGITNDMRELLAEAEENDDRRARLAIEMFAYRIRKYIGAYLAAMGGADAVIFTGGIGENSPRSGSSCWTTCSGQASTSTAAPTRLGPRRGGRITTDDGPCRPGSSHQRGTAHRTGHRAPRHRPARPVLTRAGATPPVPGTLRLHEPPATPPCARRAAGSPPRLLLPHCGVLGATIAFSRCRRPEPRLAESAQSRLQRCHRFAATRHRHPAAGTVAAPGNR
jgi:acetate kinase